MKPTRFIFTAFLILACCFQMGCQKETGTSTNETSAVVSSEADTTDGIYSFYVGTYTDGESEGIYKYSLDKYGALKKMGLAAVAENPSFLAWGPNRKYLVAVNETNKEGAGTVESYRVRGDSLALISQRSSGGAHPCFVSVNESGYVLTANYTGGNVGLLGLNQNGELSELLDVEQHTGKGTSDRQEGPHAHSAWFVPAEGERGQSDPEGSDSTVSDPTVSDPTESDSYGPAVISVDLGTNELWFSHLDNTQQKLIASNPPTLKMQTGAGPRHLAFHPNGKWIYVLNELDGTVVMVQQNSTGVYFKGDPISTLPYEFTGTNKSADIHISSDGKFVYASNRGPNDLVIFEVNPENGSLSLVGRQSTQGEGPRNFALSPDGQFLLVANQGTDNIVAFRRNPSTGLLKYSGEIEVPAPVCILF